MSKIKILPEILSNKIAAGEVVGRPASVVKELCENSLDAKSSRIIVEIEKGGKSLISVSDDGIGMNSDDALLSIERYATSKIYNDDDLFAISTLGFRGEALPSISSVSKLSLVTREKGADSGIKINIEGGKTKDVLEIGAPVGTMVEVKDLFFNTPARRKFLKTVNTEIGHIANTVSAIALSTHNVSFSLIHNKKIVKNWFAVSEPFARVADILGNSVRNELYKINSEKNNIFISGWTATPHIHKSSSRGIYIFVNGRFVKDRKLNHAVFEGFRGRLMKGQYPVAVIFINLPFNEIDVNVHPTKHEVKFANQKEVLQVITKGVETALFAAEKKRWIKTEFFEDKFSYISEKKNDFGAGTDNPSAYFGQKEEETKPGDIQTQDILAEKKPKFYTSEQKTFFKKSNKFSDLKIIGQFLKTYILCESENDLIAIDQHAAYERILFENLNKIAQTKIKSSQRLLVPEILETGYSESEIIKQLICNFAKLGLEIENFGGNTFAVKSIPSLLSEREIGPIIIEIAEKVLDKGSEKGLENAIETCLMTMSCHGAIRSNHVLYEKEITALLNQLDECENPSHCPHGRPTWICWTRKDLEKLFKRII